MPRIPNPDSEGRFKDKHLPRRLLPSALDARFLRADPSITHIVRLTQAQYAALDVKDPSTLYIII